MKRVKALHKHEGLSSNPHKNLIRGRNINLSVPTGLWEVERIPSRHSKPVSLVWSAEKQQRDPVSNKGEDEEWPSGLSSGLHMRSMALPMPMFSQMRAHAHSSHVRHFTTIWTPVSRHSSSFSVFHWPPHPPFLSLTHTHININIFREK